MALSDDAIFSARLAIRIIENEIHTFNDGVKEVNNVLSNNDNYQKFVDGTLYGTKFNESINNLLKISSDLFDIIDNVDNKTKLFLNRQEDLNREGR